MENVYTLVVVEDEELIRNSILRKVKKLGQPIRVIGAYEDGLSALEAVNKAPPNLLITDIRIPGMGGLELIEHVNYRFPSLYKIIISGYADFEYARKAISSGVFDYLLKPVKFEQFRRTMERAVAALAMEQQELTALDLSESAQITQHVKQYIRDNYHKSINVNQLADMLHVSPSYLSKSFSKCEGIPLSKYLIQVRINQAKHLLVSSNVSVGVIGERTGYPDPFYFSRIFKTVTGVSPAVYREEHRAIEE